MHSPSGPLPASVGRFRVDALLGSGGMGEVYKAFDPTLQRAVALKTVRPDISAPTFIDRLIREAQACARLKHPNVVTVYEAGEIGGMVYIVMEYLQGEDLGAALRRGGIPLEARIRIIMQVLDALAHSHAEGVIHRDIKPSNVHRQPDGSIKVVDFGLARVAQASPLTQSGGVMCTPDYASPEQLRGEPIDARTDVYSTGALAYELFTGRRPFQGDTGSVGAVILKVVSEPPPPMDVSWSRKFPEIERIVNRAMAKTPGDRFQTAEDMRNAFSAFLSTSRDALAAAQAELDAYGHRTVVEAKTLIAAGKPAAAEAMLAETLQVHPDADAVRTMLAETRRTGEPTEETTARVAPITPTPSSNHGVPQGHPPSTLSSGSGTKWWWLVGAAAAVVIGALIVIPRGAEVVPQAGAGSPTVDLPLAGATVATAANSSTSVAPPLPAMADAPAADARPALRSAPNGVPPPVADAPRTVAATASPATLSPDAGAARSVGAKALFEGKAGASADGLRAGLRYRLTRRSPDGGDADVDPATTTFRSGDRVRFAFDSNIDGYLYVVQQGSSGRWTVLFPGPRINGGRNLVRRGEQYQVPSNDWFLFDENPGTEQVFVFLSRTPLTQLPGFDKPVTSTETVVASVVEDLQMRVRSRDLVLEKETAGSIEGGKSGQATYVVNRAEVGQAVSASIALSHAP